MKRWNVGRVPLFALGFLISFALVLLLLMYLA